MSKQVSPKVSALCQASKHFARSTISLPNENRFSLELEDDEGWLLVCGAVDTPGEDVGEFVTPMLREPEELLLFDGG
jgi:hypothetical protein